jgi:hypothetical protein
MEQMNFDKRRGKFCENQVSLINNGSGSAPNKNFSLRTHQALVSGSVPVSGHCLQAASISGEFLA